MAHEGNIKPLCKYILLRSLKSWTMLISDTRSPMWISALLSVCRLLEKSMCAHLSNRSISVSWGPAKAVTAQEQGRKSKKKEECSVALSALYKNYCIKTLHIRFNCLLFLPFFSRAAFAMFSTTYFLLASEIFSKQAAKQSPSLEEDMGDFSRRKSIVHFGLCGVFIFSCSLTL